jgi:hypothetical protein
MRNSSIAKFQLIMIRISFLFRSSLKNSDSEINICDTTFQSRFYCIFGGNKLLQKIEWDSFRASFMEANCDYVSFYGA